MSVQITDAVSWVGKVDWQIKKFHGEEYSTHHGTSFNSYLIRDEKIALVETVWTPFTSEFLDLLEKEVGLQNIDYVIMNHGEPDHSGGFKELMRRIPDIPVYCTANCVKSLKGQYHGDWNFKVIKAGETLSLGKRELVFIPAPMLHWPDTMMCYLTGDNILFSNDAFGEHLATESLYNDLVDECELFQEAMKYYANILTPFSKLVTAKINEVVSLGVPVDFICPSHGVVWRSDPMQIVNKYLEWAADYQENQITVIYDTMWDGTRLMAESIAQGLREADDSLAVKIYNCATGDMNDIITEVFKSKGVLVGSPTFNKGMLASVAGILEEMRGLAFKNKKAASFGSYGWSGESPKAIANRLDEAGFELVGEGLKIMWQPDDEASEKCREFGRQFVSSFK
ncbi:Flavorubredoxin [Maridesulfovibrio ferrireducens]|uniref:Flavorubredoxin n=1 Tax=Maridesulfovibrio ferrireducens TaxID=246191 RepID=A0A1G9B9D2_9BACT|nr:anaerobic nitric oxide reductase flavorubredoxin [Maridesulfovibrio ferrireducens]SDK35475.1 Flavorubredoxin [Maridesulfovibrio ferrireducens]